MIDPARASNSAIPADDPSRTLTIADPDGAKVRHVAVVGTRTAFSFPAPRLPVGTASSK